MYTFKEVIALTKEAACTYENTLQHVIRATSNDALCEMIDTILIMPELEHIRELAVIEMRRRKPKLAKAFGRSIDNSTFATAFRFAKDETPIDLLA